MERAHGRTPAVDFEGLQGMQGEQYFTYFVRCPTSIRMHGQALLLW